MDLVVTGVVAGVLGMLMMDSLNLLCARTGMISKIDVGMIGRMAAGWARGRFRYGHPSEIEEVANEMLYGYITHYTIGVGLAVPVRARLESPGRRACITGMGACLWRRDDGSLLVLRFPFHGVWSVWKAVSRTHEGLLFPAWPTTYSMEWVLRSGSHWCRRWEGRIGQGGLRAI